MDLRAEVRGSCLCYERSDLRLHHLSDTHCATHLLRLITDYLYSSEAKVPRLQSRFAANNWTGAHYYRDQSAL